MKLTLTALAVRTLWPRPRRRTPLEEAGDLALLYFALWLRERRARASEPTP